MRIPTESQPRKSALSGSNRLRLWLLVGSLALVMAAINELRKPDTVQRLDQMFGVTPSPAEPVEAGSPDTPLVRARDEVLLGATQTKPTSAANQESSGDDSLDIKDNTYFRPQEREAWFAAFQRLRSLSSEQLSAASLGEISYAQFLQQPEQYRGRIVTLRGWVVREELQRPGSNQAGIEQYHRLWISPHGGGQWPFVVYCRELPQAFPLGDHLHEQVSIAGEFFKNWSYRYDQGLGLAPVLLADSFQWRPPVRAPARSSIPVVKLVWAAAGASVFALVVVWLAVRHTARRPRRRQASATTFSPGDSIATSTDGNDA